jgi:hypothetical protein
LNCARDLSSWRFKLALSHIGESGIMSAGATYRQDVGVGGFFEIGLDLGEGWCTSITGGYRDAFTMLMPAWMFEDSTSFSLSYTMTAPL